LTLPPSLIADLELAWFTQQEAFLGDGSRKTFDVYRGTVIWDGQLRMIEINASDTAPLVGMALLEGFELRVQAYEGGSVAILPISFVVGNPLAARSNKPKADGLERLIYQYFGQFMNKPVVAQIGTSPRPSTHVRRGRSVGG
jgi:hypothetical protein